MITSDLVLPVIFGAFVLVFLCVRPKLLIVVTAVVVLFIRTLQHLTNIGAVSNLDDALVAACVARSILECVLRGRRPRALPGTPFFLAFAAFGVISGLLHGAGPSVVTVAGTYLACKFLLFGWAVAQLSWRPSDVRRIVRGAAVLIVLVGAVCVINLLYPSEWNALVSVSGTAIDRYGLPSLIGPFIHPFDLAFFGGMTFIGVLAYREHIARGRATTALLVATGMFTLLSFRRKDLIGLLSALVAHLLRFRRSRALLAVALILPIALVLLWQEISDQIASLQADYFTLNSDEARTVLLLGSARIARDYLPFGAGFGRFGSRTAATDYSPEYFRLGIEHTYGLGPGPNQGTFLTDTSWPAILGEAGVIGALCFVVGLIAVFVALRRLERSAAVPELRFVGTVGVGWAILTLFQSTGAAVFSSPPVYVWFMGLAGLAVGLRRTLESDPLPEPARTAEVARA